MRKEVRRLAWAITVVVGGLFVAILGYDLEGVLPKWQFYSAMLLMGIGVLALQRRLEVRKAEWSPFETREREPVVWGSRWTGEVPANRWTVRAALLSGDGIDHGFAIVGHPDGRMLEANWEEKGWRIVGALTGHQSDCAVYRKDGNLEPVRAPTWNLWAPEPGDYFTRDEAEEILATFAERKSMPDFACTRMIWRSRKHGS